MNLKSIITLTLFLFISKALFSQDTIIADPYENYVVLYTIGENWDTTKQAFEQNYFKEHSSHLAALRKSKTISVGGRFGEYGILIIKAKNEDDARDLILNDVAIQHQLFEAEIYPVNIFYKGCIE